jgi:hypothetical protein
MPLRGMFNVGTFGSLDEMAKLADFVPPDAGEKTTWIVQVSDSLKVFEEQFSDCMVNSLELAPLKEI